MFVALPVRQQQKHRALHLSTMWSKVKGVGMYFNVSPSNEKSIYSYVEELRIAKRRGVTRVVKAILQERL